MIILKGQPVTDRATYLKLKKSSKYIKTMSISHCTNGLFDNQLGHYVGPHRIIDVVKGVMSLFPGMKCCSRDLNGNYFCNKLLEYQEYYFLSEFFDDDQKTIDEWNKKYTSDNRYYAAYCKECWEKFPGSFCHPIWTALDLGKLFIPCL